MQKDVHAFERITIALPAGISRDIDSLKDELRLSKSEIMRRALERFVFEHRRRKIRRIAETMVREYETNVELTDFTVLDGEDFK